MRREENHRPVSRILSRCPKAPVTIIYLSPPLPVGIELPTLLRIRFRKHGRAAHGPIPRDGGRRYTWHFSTQGLPPRLVAGTGRGLLPHVFTLAAAEAEAVILCGTVCSRRSGTRLFTGALPYAVRTFLHPRLRGSRWPGLWSLSYGPDGLNVKLSQSRIGRCGQSVSRSGRRSPWLRNRRGDGAHSCMKPPHFCWRGSGGPPP